MRERNGIRKIIQMKAYAKQKQNHSIESKLVVTKGERMGMGGSNWVMRLTDTNYYI